MILNATQDRNGEWRSVESLSFFRIYRDAGAIYRQALAQGARELGYAVREGKDSMFELAAVPDKAIREFSARGNQVEAALAERGKTRAEATAAEKATLTLATREAKQEAGREQLVPGWRAQAEAAGFGEKERIAAIAESEKCAVAMTAERGPSAQHRAEIAAMEAVAAAARHLSEREAVFGAAALEARAGERAGGLASAAQIAAAVDRARGAGDLVARDQGARGRGFTTREAVATERRMLAIEGDGRGSASPALDRQEALRAVTDAAQKVGFAIQGHTDSPLPGPSGNREILLVLEKPLR